MKGTIYTDCHHNNNSFDHQSATSIGEDKRNGEEFEIFSFYNFSRDTSKKAKFGKAGSGKTGSGPELENWMR